MRLNCPRLWEIFEHLNAMIFTVTDFLPVPKIVWTLKQNNTLPVILFWGIHELKIPLSTLMNFNMFF